MKLLNEFVLERPTSFSTIASSGKEKQDSPCRQRFWRESP